MGPCEVHDPPIAAQNSAGAASLRARPTPGSMVSPWSFPKVARRRSSTLRSPTDSLPTARTAAGESPGPCRHLVLDRDDRLVAPVLAEICSRAVPLTRSRPCRTAFSTSGCSTSDGTGRAGPPGPPAGDHQAVAEAGALELQVGIHEASSSARVAYWLCSRKAQRMNSAKPTSRSRARPGRTDVGFDRGQRVVDEMRLISAAGGSAAPARCGSLTRRVRPGQRRGQNRATSAAVRISAASADGPAPPAPDQCAVDGDGHGNAGPHRESPPKPQPRSDALSSCGRPDTTTSCRRRPRASACRSEPSQAMRSVRSAMARRARRAGAAGLCAVSTRGGRGQPFAQRGDGLAGAVQGLVGCSLWRRRPCVVMSAFRTACGLRGRLGALRRE